MRVNKAATLSMASLAAAQRPSNTSICDFYTTALLNESTAENQATLLTLVVNTVVIGNYTQPNVGIKVPGILAPGEIDGEAVNLLPYFNGDLASSNRGGDEGVSVNFLDGGGAAPLMENKPAEDETSNQYFLLTHLYQFFGSLLGCSEQGMPGFDAYDGFPSQYEVHKFMALDVAEVTYFISQVGAAAASFGVAEEDITVVAGALNKLFNVRCAPETTVIPAQGAQLQSICIDESCPLAENATCSAYEEVEPPKNATTSGSPTPTSSAGGGSEETGGSGSGGGSGGGSGSDEPAPSPTGGAMANGVGLAGVLIGLAAFAL